MLHVACYLTVRASVLAMLSWSPPSVSYTFLTCGLLSHYLLVISGMLSSRSYMLISIFTEVALCMPGAHLNTSQMSVLPLELPLLTTPLYIRSVSVNKVTINWLRSAQEIILLHSHRPLFKKRFRIKQFIYFSLEGSL